MNQSPADSRPDPTNPVNDEPPYRVLVVEDDRSQALFAEGVLHGVGIQTQWVAMAAEVLEAIESFGPDLVLMDLHLPDSSGTDLTARIRTLPEHAHLPIVFLTGDSDPETEYRVLDSGADDFLEKPIRPRHLIAAVHSRVRRARQARAVPQPAAADVRDPVTGLLRRDQLLAHLADAPGVLMLEIQSLPALQERYGLSGVATLVREAGTRLAALADDAARLSDGSFIVLSSQDDEAALAATARRLRDALGQPIEYAGTPLRLRTAIAYAASAGEDALDALERTLRQARAEPSGLAAHRPDTPSAAVDNEVSELRAALDNDRFELAFQPIAAVAGGDEAQYQVLLRLREDSGRLLGAASLIARADKAGLLGTIDRQVLERSLVQLSPATGRKPLRLFVPQSPQAIAADPAGQWLLEAIGTHGVETGSLVIDLRLVDAQVHWLALSDFCAALAPHGVRFCLGHYTHDAEASALLTRLPLSYVRLSQRYSEQAADTAMRAELGEAIEAVHAAGLRVIGAQVDNPSAAAALWMSGIDYIQGNLVQGASSSLDFDFHHSVL